MTLWEIYDAGTFYSICILSCFIAGEIFSLQLHVKKKDALAGHPSCLYKENHALDAWFGKAYGGEQKILLR